ncbi:hypothetical protein QE152_g10870 [Popillia japonica]|uniref:Reverse transcriptase domain-containing protein n=1 Tax=Popillia japonica TaxID=7064 RepID=A0AAW1LPK6_POPJA
MSERSRIDALLRVVEGIVEAPGRLVMYADDATFISSDRDLQRLAMTVRAIETRAESWYSANRLMLNRDKTQKIVFSTASDVGADVPDAALLKTQKIVFSTASDVGADVPDAALLGVVLDSKLCWSSLISVNTAL